MCKRKQLSSRNNFVENVFMISFLVFHTVAFSSKRIQRAAKNSLLETETVENSTRSAAVVVSSVVVSFKRIIRESKFRES